MQSGGHGTQISPNLKFILSHGLHVPVWFTILATHTQLCDALSNCSFCLHFILVTAVWLVVVWFVVVVWFDTADWFVVLLLLVVVVVVAAVVLFVLFLVLFAAVELFVVVLGITTTTVVLVVLFIAKFTHVLTSWAYTKLGGHGRHPESSG